MKSIRIAAAVCVAALSWLSIGPAPTAEACTFALPEDHVLDPEEQAVDQTAPQAPQIDSPHLVRRPPPDANGCGAVSSCDGSGSVILPVSALDDRTPEEQMGYVLRLVDGELPEGLSLPAGPVRPFSGGELALVFIDRDQPVSFTLSVRAVDLAGNEGPEVEVVFADDVGGCSASGAGRTTSALLLLAAIALAVARRRRA